MSKNLNEDGVEYIDGRPVTIYEGKFVNIFETEAEDAIGIADGDLVTFLVTARAETPKFVSVKKTGEVKRQNQFRIVEQSLMDPDKAKAMYDALDTHVSGINTDLVTVTKIQTSPDLGFDPKDLEL